MREVTKSVILILVVLKNANENESFMKKLILILSILGILFTNEVYAGKPVVVIPMAGEDAAPGIAGFASQGASDPFLGRNRVIVSLPMTFPSSGTVVINANGFMAVFSEEFVSVRCSINKNGTSVDFSNELSMALTFGQRDFSSQGGFSLPFSGTRGFKVNSGTDTFKLVCSLLGGEKVKIRKSNITGMFFPD